MKQLLILTLILALVPTFGVTLQAEEVIELAQSAANGESAPALTADDSDILSFPTVSIWESDPKVQKTRGVNCTIEGFRCVSKAACQADCIRYCGSFEGDCGGNRCYCGWI